MTPPPNPAHPAPCGWVLPGPDTVVEQIPDGPLLVRGPAVVIGPDGAPAPQRRRTVAVCRCRASKIAPWCDGSHRLAGRTAEVPG